MTYIDVPGADDYVVDNYVESDEKYTAWAALSVKDKAIYLRKAASVIDRQPLRGIKASELQDMAFPRAIKSSYSRRDLPILHTQFNSDWIVQTEVPEEVKHASVEIALDLAVGISERINMQRQGVKSYSIGHLSETLSGKQVSVPYEAMELLRPYLAGSVRIV